MKTLLHILVGAARGGCEWDALCLIQEATQFTHEVLVVGSSNVMSKEFEQAGAAVRHLEVLGQSSRRVVVAIRSEVKRYRPQGIVAWHGMVVLPEILHALHDFQGHVLIHGGNPAHTLPRWVDWRYRLREWRLGRRCEGTYVCCSQYVADSFEHNSYLRRFSRVVVPNGVKPLTVPPHNPRNIPHGAPFTIGMLARLDAIKDHAALLRAFALVHREWPSARLELAGDGERRSALEQLSCELGIIPQVRFLGMISDVYAAMSKWDIFAYVTTDREGLGNALMEAMMLGLPCVASDIGPIRELAGNPSTIELVHPGDPALFAAAILQLVGALEQRRKSSLQSRERAASEFARQVYAQRYLSLLKI